jgi:hypothetical protein
MAFDHGSIVDSGISRLRAKLSYTNIAFALATPEFTLTELRALYRAALGHDVAVTNLKRVLTRRNLIQPLGNNAATGPTGGRPPALYRFRTNTLQVTDPGSVFRTSPTPSIPRRGPLDRVVEPSPGKRRLARDSNWEWFASGFAIEISVLITRHPTGPPTRPVSDDEALGTLPTCSVASPVDGREFCTTENAIPSSGQKGGSTEIRLARRTG